MREYGLWVTVAAALAVPVFLVTNESFRPIAERIDLEGREASWSIDLAVQDSLFLEFEFTVRASNAGKAGIILAFNDTPLATLAADRLYVTERARLLVPLAAVRAGRNVLQVSADGPPSTTFSLNLRLHNYYGISPRFPRAVVVSDEAFALWWRQRSSLEHALRLAGCFIASVILVWSLGRLSGRTRGTGAYALMLSPSVLPWCVLAYGLTRSLHVWVWPESLIALCLLPCLLTALVLWIPAHRTLVARVAAVAVMTVVLLEGALRVFNIFVPSSIFYTGSYSRYRGQPGGPHLDSRLNSRGFNDIEHELAKPPHVYRIAALGDSVAFGVVPYRANYLTLLETELAASRAVEVINLGVAGTDPRDYLAILLQEGLAFSPDLVMVGFFIGNDFESADRKPYERSFAATSAYFLWRRWGAGAPTVIGTNAPAGTYDDNAPTLAADRFLEIAVDRASIYRKDDAALQTALARVVGDLRDMRDITRRAGADLLIVLIPDEVQIDGTLQADVARGYRSTLDRFDFQRPNRLLADALANEGIGILDLLPVFAEEGRRTRLYKPRDTHWNIAGNHLAAVAIANALRERIGG